MVVQETTGASETTCAGQTLLGARSNRGLNGLPVQFAVLMDGGEIPG